jgi:hypothetical protein
MTTGSSTIKSPQPVSGKVAAGRNIEDWGSRRIALFELSSITVGTNGTGEGNVAFDWKKAGCDFVPTIVLGQYKAVGTSDHQYVVTAYDYLNKAFCLWDLTDGDDGSGDTPAGTISVVVIGE